MSKRFGGIRALQDVSIELREGEVLGLVGENGAGKSTLLSVLSGALRADAGSIFLRGERVELRNYLQANLNGVFRAHQDQGLLANMTVADNMYIGHENRFTTFGYLHRGRMVAATNEHLARDTAIKDRATARSTVGELPLDVRQMVEIIRAFAVAELLETGRPAIFLDETTASLNLDEVEDLYGYIRRQRRRASFIFVSHRLHEVLEICDRIYVMKDGSIVTELRPEEASEEELHQLMVGRPRNEHYYREDLRRTGYGPPLLRIDHASAGSHFHDVSFDVRAGEIFVLGGVTGSGKSALARAIAGDLKLSGGEVRVGDEVLAAAGCRDRLGRVSYGPLDRQRDGLCLHQSIRLNVTLSSLDKVVAAPGVLSRREERRRATAAMDRYSIVAPDIETNVSTLSGGNQQKVMLARLADSDSKVLVVDNPTRGVDAGSRPEIYSYLRRLASAGIAILLVTDDLSELLGMADRVGIMKDGRLEYLAREGETDSLTEELVVAKMV